MSATVISFLGTNDYKECNYFYKDQESGPVKYVQEAMIKLFCSHWSEDDRVLIFVTKEARKKNWNDRLETIMPKNICVEAIDIPEGTSESEIWQIFQIVFEKINDKDDVIFDITHSFRSLPMLGMVLLNYAKVLKQIKVSGIYYGAFETLGPTFNIEARIPNPSDRKAPILELTSFSNLQDWTNASNVFKNHGISEPIKKLAEDEYKPLLKNSKGADEVGQILKLLSMNIEDITNSFNTSNGRDIVYGEIFTDIKKSIKDFSKTNILPALRPLLDYTTESISEFTDKNIRNGFLAVKWCIKNNLIQQGYTLLQENIITYIADLHKKDYSEVFVRTDIGSAFHIFSRKLTKDKWKVYDKDFIDILIKDDSIMKLSKEFDSITVRRNELNHANFTNRSQNTIDYKSKLTQSYEKIEKILGC